MDRREDSSDGDYHEDAKGQATQRVGPCEEAFKNDKSDEHITLAHCGQKVHLRNFSFMYFQ